MALGSYPSRRYYRSWISQRLLNRAPEYTIARRLPWSLSQQLVNPMAQEIQETYQQIADARYNMFVSTANIKLLDKVYKAELTPGMVFSSTTKTNGEKLYTPPTVYAMIDSVEYEITIAENNDIQTLAYDCLPSRISDGEVSYTYSEIIPRTLVSNLSATTPEDIVINGHLYITLRDNTTWEYRGLERIYYPKCYITGVTRKGTVVTEAVPLRYNGTFKTINEWQSVTDVFVSYLDSTAYITIETFPFDTEGLVDTRNIHVPHVKGERVSFLKLNQESYGTVFSCEAFTSANMDIVRLGMDTRESFYKMELVDSNENTVTLNGFVPLPFSRFIYGVDDTKFYVYDINFPLPDFTNMTDSTEAMIELYSDNWVYSRNDTVTIMTRNRNNANVPFEVRWTLTSPSGTSNYVLLDGTLLPTTEEGWINNDLWGKVGFREQQIDFTVSENGNYIVSFEAKYINENTSEVTTYTTKYLAYVPTITPEVELTLPSGLRYPEDISIDSDGIVWLKKYGFVYKLDVFHDYYIVDYERNRIWLRESYPSVRIVI